MKRKRKDESWKDHIQMHHEVKADQIRKMDEMLRTKMDQMGEVWNKKMWDELKKPQPFQPWEKPWQPITPMPPQQLTVVLSTEQVMQLLEGGQVGININGLNIVIQEDLARQ